MKIGVLGGGHLGRMLALAGYPLDLSFRFFDPSPDAPAGQLAELVSDPLDGPPTVARFAADLQAITYEGDNVSLATVQALASRMRVFPPPGALEVAQDRVVQKEFFTRLGIPTPPYAAVSSREALDGALGRMGLPAVLKTRRPADDGKGEATLRELADIERAWSQMGNQPLILEGLVPFEREVSLIAARNPHGETAIYPLTEDHHTAGVQSHSRVLGPGLASLQQAEAEAYMVRVMSALRYVGVIAIEFFQLYGRLLAGKLVSRVHNSGHWTIEGAETSQFENHLRAGLGRPLGSPVSTGYCGMVNLIGEIPDPGPILRVQGAHLHLYGEKPRPGRKLGHVTIRANDAKSLEARMAHLGQILKRNLS